MKRARSVSSRQLDNQIRAWKRSKIPRSIRSGGGTITRVKQTFVAGNITVTAGGAASFGLDSFSLNNLPNDAEYKGIYDLYRFDKVTIHYISNQSAPSVNVAASPATSGCLLFTAKNYGGVSPASANTVLEYETCKVTGANQDQIRSVIPRLLVNGVSTSAKSGTWVPTIDDSLLWYGIAYALTAPSIATTVCRYDVVVTYHMSFKNMN
jgi:hypothetical protein